MTLDCLLCRMHITFSISMSLVTMCKFSIFQLWDTIRHSLIPNASSIILTKSYINKKPETDLIEGPRGLTGVRCFISFCRMNDVEGRSCSPPRCAFKEYIWFSGGIFASAGSCSSSCEHGCCTSSSCPITEHISSSGSVVATGDLCSSSHGWSLRSTTFSVTLQSNQIERKYQLPIENECGNLYTHLHGLSSF